MPPSPLLSALKASNTYFIVVCNVRVQITQDTGSDDIFGRVVRCHALYCLHDIKGDVPMSPNTMPRVTRSPAMLRRFNEDLSFIVEFMFI